ncbi:hypothetical protein RN001_006298 [Aquatica leii]|uniref:Regulatory protein zeste n=1 Tax=Aquatica leii TaxID=1421715 RepID=A0AAN7Q1K9_9COLE|nr:hypothetical protein RN001_006298 [Aquatica leii]
MNNQSNRIRAPRFEAAEKRIIFNIIEKYAHIIENKKTDAVTSEEKNKAWVAVAAELNRSCPSSHYRTTESISKFWKNSKKTARHQTAQERQERIKTGGGTPQIEIKNEHYETVLSIINGKTVFGHENPFDTDKVGDITEIESGNGGDEAVDETDENIVIIFEDLDSIYEETPPAEKRRHPCPHPKKLLPQKMDRPKTSGMVRQRLRQSHSIKTKQPAYHWHTSYASVTTELQMFINLENEIIATTQIKNGNITITIKHKNQNLELSKSKITDLLY